MDRNRVLNTKGTVKLSDYPEVVAHCVVCGGWIDELMMEDTDPSAPCCSTECYGAWYRFMNQ